MTNFLERIKIQAEEKAKIEIERIRKEAEKQAIKAKKAEEKTKKEAEKQAENRSKLEGILETAKNLLKEEFSIDNVAKFTNLTLADVKALTL